MIGMIGPAGIATRNAILLIEFVEAQKAKGEPLVKSLIEAGALRARPILLTSPAGMLAAWPITLDPIFSGLAWLLIFGIAHDLFHLNCRSGGILHDLCKHTGGSRRWPSVR